MSNLINANLRPLSLDEVDQISGAKGRQPIWVTVEKCTTTTGADGKRVETCKEVSSNPL